MDVRIYVCMASHVVWRGVHRDRLKVLRAVLLGPPFKLRTPEELVAKMTAWTVVIRVR